MKYSAWSPTSVCGPCAVQEGRDNDCSIMELVYNGVQCELAYQQHAQQITDDFVHIVLLSVLEI